MSKSAPATSTLLVGYSLTMSASVGDVNDTDHLMQQLLARTSSITEQILDLPTHVLYQLARSL